MLERTAALALERSALDLVPVSLAALVAVVVHERLFLKHGQSPLRCTDYL